MAYGLDSEGRIVAQSPWTSKQLAVTEIDSVETTRAAVDRSRIAQASWGDVPVRERVRAVDRWRRELASQADDWADAIRDEAGKPRVEALGEVLSTLDAMRWTVRNAAKVLADRRLGSGLQRLALIPSARLSWRPLGVIGMLGTWNYPLYLNAPPIAQAVAAGNAVVWKPSEHATATGKLLQASVAQHLPRDLVLCVNGLAETGRALLDSGIDKAVFTGGIAAGRRVLADLGARGIPAVAELSGFDAAIVFPDLNPRSIAPALAWASFVGAGQTCVAIKRIYTIGDPEPVATALAEQAATLRAGDPADSGVDIGPLISADARARLSEIAARAIEAGATRMGAVESHAASDAAFTPTVFLARDDRAERVLQGCFGPVVVVRGVRDTDEAVEAVNASDFALAASVWSRDLRRARAAADRLVAGVVSINDAVTPSAHAGGPFGGFRSSGHGRTKGALGLLEFVASRCTYVQPHWIPRPQLPPYSGRTERLLRGFIRFMHGG
ncbi:MAG: aldehyde dehydrogenase family protein [Isosphaeraceae bacterium]|nr:aldehyde dehydrogenase family protein [Isosphaeraceae bacterium]